MKTCTIAWLSAHPDDETFSSACTIAEAVMRGCQVVLLAATPGDAGRTGYLGPMTKNELAARRKQELQAAGKLLGIAEIKQLGYPDGQLATVERSVLLGEVVRFLNETKASVAVTFGEDGIYGHPDHVALHHAVREAVTSGFCPSVQKLYYFYNILAEEETRPPTVTIDVAPRWEQKKKALLAHESQLLGIERVFGDIRQSGATPSEKMKTESFVLSWERGSAFPLKTETFLTDGLL